MAQTGTTAGQSGLRRNALGVAAVTFFVVSAAAPLTAVAGGYPIAMLLGNGAGVPLAVVLTTLILLIFSVGYTAMAQHIANAGSFFAFTARGLGGVAGGAAAYIAILAYNTMQMGLYGLFGAVTAGVLGEYGLVAPWWVWSLIAMAIVGVFGYMKIDMLTSGGRIPIYSDRHCPFGTAFGFRMANHWISSMGELLHVQKGDGLQMLRGSTSTDYEFRLISYPLYANNCPKNHGRVLLQS